MAATSRSGHSQPLGPRLHGAEYRRRRAQGYDRTRRQGHRADSPSRPGDTQQPSLGPPRRCRSSRVPRSPSRSPATAGINAVYASAVHAPPPRLSPGPAEAARARPTVSARGLRPRALVISWCELSARHCLSQRHRLTASLSASEALTAAIWCPSGVLVATPPESSPASTETATDLDSAGVGRRCKRRLPSARPRPADGSPVPVARGAARSGRVIRVGLWAPPGWPVAGASSRTAVTVCRNAPQHCRFAWMRAPCVGIPDARLTRVPAQHWRGARLRRRLDG